MSFTNLTGAMTEAQFTYLIQLIGQAYVADPAKRAAALVEAAGYDKAQARAKIDALKPAAKAAPAVMPAYVPPFGHYQINGQHVQVKKSKYGSLVYVYVDDIYQGALGKSAKAAEAIAALTDDAAAYAAVIEFAKVTGKCGVCHTKLTDPKSITAGIGPVCAKKYGK